MRKTQVHLHSDGDAWGTLNGVFTESIFISIKTCVLMHVCLCASVFFGLFLWFQLNSYVTCATMVSSAKVISLPISPLTSLSLSLSDMLELNWPGVTPCCGTTGWCTVYDMTIFHSMSHFKVLYVRELKDVSSERHKHCNCSTSGTQKSHLYKVAAWQTGTCLKAAIGYLENEMLWFKIPISPPLVVT